MEIINSKIEDLRKIVELYDAATAYMIAKEQVAWPKFSEQMIMEEIKQGRQWKLLLEGQIACIWATTFTDPEIWGEKDDDPSVYIHRIATNPDFRGNNLVKKIVDWVREYALENNKKFIRMDTVGLNKGLISHYEKLGFAFLGTKILANTKGLPEHYNKGEVCYFEIAL